MSAAEALVHACVNGLGQCPQGSWASRQVLGLPGKAFTLTSSLWHYMVSTLAERLYPGTVEFWMLLSPVLAYWAVAVVYECLDHSSSTWVGLHRVTRKQPGRPNSISRMQVFRRVLLQQLLQSLLAVAALLADPQQCSTNPPKGWLQTSMQFIIGMFVMDAWQYWIHRTMHTYTWLYKNIHSTHHLLLIPYAMGALYNHPAEALLLDTLGAGISMYAAGMSCRLATVFFCFSTVKTVLDHSAYLFPLNPLHNVFPNGAAYHDVHHDNRGIKKNYSQPFFTFWDIIMNTFLDPTQFHLNSLQLEKHVHGLVSMPSGVALAAGAKVLHPVDLVPEQHAAGGVSGAQHVGHAKGGPVGHEQGAGCAVPGSDMPAQGAATATTSSASAAGQVPAQGVGQSPMRARKTVVPQSPAAESLVTRSRAHHLAIKAAS